MQIYPDYQFRKPFDNCEILKKYFLPEDLIPKLPFYFVAHRPAPLYFVVIFFGPDSNTADKQ